MTTLAGRLNGLKVALVVGTKQEIQNRPTCICASAGETDRDARSCERLSKLAKTLWLTEVATLTLRTSSLGGGELETIGCQFPG
jgi:hypothetical protein